MADYGRLLGVTRLSAVYLQLTTIARYGGVIRLNVGEQSPLTHITAFSAHKSLHAYPTYNDTSDAKRLTSVALARTLH